MSNIIQEEDVPTEEEIPLEDADLIDDETEEEESLFDLDEFEE